MFGIKKGEFDTGILIPGRAVHIDLGDEFFDAIVVKSTKNKLKILYLEDGQTCVRDISIEVDELFIGNLKMERGK